MSREHFHSESLKWEGAAGVAFWVNNNWMLSLFSSSKAESFFLISDQAYSIVNGNQNKKLYKSSFLSMVLLAHIVMVKGFKAHL